MRKLLLFGIILSLLIGLSQAVSAQSGSQTATYTWTFSLDQDHTDFQFDLPASPFGLQTNLILFNVSWDSIVRFDVTPDDAYISNIGSGQYCAWVDKIYEISTADYNDNRQDWSGATTIWGNTYIDIYPVPPGGVSTSYYRSVQSAPNWTISAILFDDWGIYNPTNTHTAHFSTGTDVELEGTGATSMDGRIDMESIGSDNTSISGKTRRIFWDPVTGEPLGSISVDYSFQDTYTLSATYYGTPVPEPSSLAALLCSLSGLSAVACRKKR